MTGSLLVEGALVGRSGAFRPLARNAAKLAEAEPGGAVAANWFPFAGTANIPQLHHWMKRRNDMEIARSSHARFEPGDAGRFTGSVWLNPGLAAPDATNVAVVSFSPGARTHWHAHPGGQFLAVTSGRGLVASRGESIVELAPGDVVHVPAGEWHWHGGGSESPMTHVAVNGGGAPEWGEPVTDDEYLGAEG